MKTRKKNDINISEILAREDKISGFIYLYPEGASLRAYWHSACKILHRYQDDKEIVNRYAEGASVKHFKSVKQEVHSVLFPKGSLHRLFKSSRAEWVSDSCIRILCPPIDSRSSASSDGNSDILSDSDGDPVGGALSGLILETLKINCSLSSDYRRIFNIHSEIIAGIRQLIPGVHLHADSPEKKEEIAVQAREHVKRLKIQAGHLFTTQRIDAKQHDDVFRQADSLLNQLSDWQEAGAAPPAAPLMSEHDLQD